MMNATNRRPISIKKKATIADVAKLAGVSRSTASSALNEKSGKYAVSSDTLEAVRQAAKQLQFEPNPNARHLSLGRASETIALFALVLDMSVGTRKLQLLQEMLNDRGYQSPIYVCGQSGEKAAVEQMHNLRLQRPRAIACNCNTLQASILEELRLYAEEGGIVVCYDSPVDLDCDKVVFDREHNTYLATLHLLEKGHTRIGLYANWPRHDPLRFAGFQRALDEFNVDVAYEWMFPREDGTDLNELIGARMAQEFIEFEERPTALCIVDDVVAAAFITALHRHGLRVPEDVSVIGQDDMPVGAYICPVPLTTVSQPMEEIARQVVNLLMERIEGYQGESQEVVVRGELMLRQSTAMLGAA